MEKLLRLAEERKKRKDIPQYKLNIFTDFINRKLGLVVKPDPNLDMIIRVKNTMEQHPIVKEHLEESFIKH